MTSNVPAKATTFCVFCSRPHIAWIYVSLSRSQSFSHSLSFFFWHIVVCMQSPPHCTSNCTVHSICKRGFGMLFVACCYRFAWQVQSGRLWHTSTRQTNCDYSIAIFVCNKEENHHGREYIVCNVIYCNIEYEGVVLGKGLWMIVTTTSTYHILLKYIYLKDTTSATLLNCRKCFLPYILANAYAFAELQLLDIYCKRNFIVFYFHIFFFLF